MKYFIILLSALIFSGAVLFFSISDLKKVESEKDSPDEPYEAFMLQRTYPNKIFDIKAYQSALNSAVIQTQHQRGNSAVSWTLEGPGNIGGRFNCIAVSPADTNIMYAGSANGGVWKTIDNGVNWLPVFDSIPYQAIGAIAINPNNADEIWVGTGDLNITGTIYLGNGVYKSTDAGQTWTYLGLSDSYIVSSIIFNAANTNEVLIATMGNSFAKDNNRGIYRTINSGLNFSLVNFVNDSTGFIDMVQDPVNPSIVYAGSFSRIRKEISSVTLGTEVYVYKSTDFGQTWNILSGGLPNGLSHERLGITICKNSPDILYALYSSSDTIPELYKSIDAGLSWSQVNIFQFDMQSYGSYGWYFGKIYMDPVDPDILYIPGVDLQYSVDGGQSWNMLTPPWYFYQVHGDGHYILFSSPDEFFYCTDGGLYKTTDGGVNWTDIENIPNNQFYAVTENQNNVGEYAGGVQDNGTMYGNASVINNFNRIYGGDGFTVAYTGNASLVYSESQSGNIVYDDLYPSGNWYPVDKDSAQNYNWHTPYFVSKFGSDTVYLAGQKVMRIDGAPYGSFTNISPELNDSASPWRVRNISTINQSPINGAILYAGTADGKVWNTLNGGNTWNDITPFQGISYYVTKVMPSPNDAAKAYVTRSGYRANDNTPLVFMTDNNGSTWQNISGDLPLLAINDIEIYPGHENIIFIANDAGVYMTTNGGVNWQRLGDNMPYVAVLDIDLNYNAQKIIAGTFGRSMFSIDITNIFTGIKPVADDSEISIFPNPASDFIFIKLKFNIDEVKIYSVSGDLVMKTKLNDIDVSEFRVGSYFLEIESGGKRVVRKFLKM